MCSPEIPLFYMPPPQFRGDAYEKDVPYKKYGCLCLPFDQPFLASLIISTISHKFRICIFTFFSTRDYLLWIGSQPKYKSLIKMSLLTPVYLAVQNIQRSLFLICSAELVPQIIVIITTLLMECDKYTLVPSLGQSFSHDNDLIFIRSGQ